jgi:hypothetical protein
MKKRSLLYALLLSLCLVATATAGGSGAYPNGAEGFMAGAVPPPGTYFLAYSNYYTADSFKDNDGDDYAAGPLADIDIEVWANVLRVLHVTGVTLFGANYAVHAFIPYADMDFDFGAAPFNTMSDSRSGLGDIIVDPFILAWHSKHCHWVTGLDIFIPTGKYDANKEPINPGNNVWTFEPVFAMTYLNGPFDVSFKFMYDISTTNDDYLNPGTGLIADLKPGQEFHFDYAFGYNLSPAWEVGINGYYYRQVTDDEINGADVPDQKGQVLAAGPAVKYNYKNMSFILKSQWETAVKNRPQGVSNWFKFVYAF